MPTAATIDATTDATTVATALVVHLEQAWNGADGACFAAVFTEDSDFVDIRGVHHVGRAAIAGGHQAIFDSIYAGSTVSYEVEVARALSPGVVLAVASATLDAPSGPLQGVNHSRITVVMTESAERWVISAFHNTLVA